MQNQLEDLNGKLSTKKLHDKRLAMAFEYELKKDKKKKKY